MDCYLAANLAGATPTGRPEGLEVNPNNPNEVIIAYTDGLPGGADFAGEGMPAPRIFRVAKYEADVNAAQGSGGLDKITEDSADGTGLTFTWERFLQGGEDGASRDASATNAAVACTGFANIDNLEFDDAGNLWLVTDMSTGHHNGFNTSYSGATLQPGQRTIEHAGAGSGDARVGVFGNNWLFCVPFSGPDAGKVIPFGYGPTRCEMTGPFFVGDTLILSLQHPSEDSPINGDPKAGGEAASTISRDIQMLALDGTTYTQTRTLPRGSNFPSTLPEADGGIGTPIADAPSPKRCVIGIRRLP